MELIQAEHTHDQERQNVLEWLSPLNYRAKQNDILSRRQAGTGEWLQKTDEFQAWMGGITKVLWCPGMRMDSDELLN